MSVGVGHYAVVSALLFALGLYGVLARRNPLGILMALGVLFAAPVVALVGFTHVGQGGVTPPLGDAMASLVIVAVCGEVALGLALVLMLWRRLGTADVDQLIDAEE